MISDFRYALNFFLCDSGMGFFALRGVVCVCVFGFPEVWAFVYIWKKAKYGGGRTG